MTFQIPIAVRDLAALTNTTLVGNPDNIATGINEIHKVRSGDVTFVDAEKYYHSMIRECLRRRSTT